MTENMEDMQTGIEKATATMCAVAGRICQKDENKCCSGQWSKAKEDRVCL